MTAGATLRFLIATLAIVSPLTAFAAEEPAQAPTNAAQAPTDAAQAGPITVEVAGGRVLTGQLDMRTDAAHLWLRWERPGVIVLRPIEWDGVLRTRLAGHDLDGERFRQIVVAVRQTLPPPPSPEKRTVLTLVGKEPSPQEVDNSPAAGRISPSAYHREPSSPVRSLAIDAALANWDATVEADGLVVRIAPLDGEGRMVPVAGTLEVDLTGWRQVATPLPQPFLELGRWTRTVSPDDFGGQGAVYRLPFGAIHPEFGTTIAPRGAVHARLSVPGEGTFEATASDVRIRPFSAVRDRWQQVSGSRFFPQERTGAR